MRCVMSRGLEHTGRRGEHGISETRSTGNQPVSILILVWECRRKTPPNPIRDSSGHPLLSPDMQSKVQQIAKAMVGDLTPLRHFGDRSHVPGVPSDFRLGRGDVVVAF